MFVNINPKNGSTPAILVALTKARQGIDTIKARLHSAVTFGARQEQASCRSLLDDLEEKERELNKLLAEAQDSARPKK